MTSVSYGLLNQHKKFETRNRQSLIKLKHGPLQLVPQPKKFIARKKDKQTGLKGFTDVSKAQKTHTHSTSER